MDVLDPLATQQRGRPLDPPRDLVRRFHFVILDVDDANPEGDLPVNLPERIEVGFRAVGEFEDVMDGARMKGTYFTSSASLKSRDPRGRSSRRA